MLKKYEYSGVHESISIIDAFLDISFQESVNSISNGFYQRWSTLRSERNTIIHENSKYFTTKRIRKIMKLLDESITVFANLSIFYYKQ